MKLFQKQTWFLKIGHLAPSSGYVVIFVFSLTANCYNPVNIMIVVPSAGHNF